jgi:hypothetical protein
MYQITLLIDLKAFSLMWWLTLIIPATGETEIGRILVPGQLQQKVIETSHQPTSLAWRYTPVISATGRCTYIGEYWFKARAGTKTQDLT